MVREGTKVRTSEGPDGEPGGTRSRREGEVGSGIRTERRGREDGRFGTRQLSDSGDWRYSGQGSRIGSEEIQNRPRDRGESGRG